MDFPDHPGQVHVPPCQHFHCRLQGVVRFPGPGDMEGLGVLSLLQSSSHLAHPADTQSQDLLSQFSAPVTPDNLVTLPSKFSSLEHQLWKRLPKFKSQQHHLPAVTPWARDLISLCLNTFTCKMEITIVSWL